MKRRLVALFVLGASACASDPEAERLPERTFGGQATRPVDRERPPLALQLDAELARAEQGVAVAKQSGDSADVIRSELALDEAKRRVAAEQLRQQKLADLRARTPDRFVDPAQGKPPTASRPGGKAAPAPSGRRPPKTPEPAEPMRPVESQPTPAATSPAGETESAPAPASVPASRPASVDDAELESLTERVRSLIKLRRSTGDSAGANRVSDHLSLLRHDYQRGRRVEALAAIRRLAQEADR